MATTKRITSELTRRRESKHPSPQQASCERRSRRSRPTICSTAPSFILRYHRQTYVLATIPCSLGHRRFQLGEFSSSRRLVPLVSERSRGPCFQRILPGIH